jgi:hypothetical protein
MSFGAFKASNRTSVHTLDFGRNCVTSPQSCRVPLTQNQFALVDTEDLPILAPYRWTAFRSRNTWYAKAHVGGHTLYMHRLILFGKRAASERRKVDHWNRNGLDNRRSNLRSVTHGQNIMNSVGRPSVRRSRYKGVSVRRHPLKPFRACIQVNGKQRHLGYYPSEIEAAQAYDKAALVLFGTHARINFPDVIEVGVSETFKERTNLYMNNILLNAGRALSGDSESVTEILDRWITRR